MNRFWRNTRLEKHRPDPADPLDTNNLPPAPPSNPPRRKIVCEFCECQLTPNGEIISLGTKAKIHRDHSDVVERKDSEIHKLTEEISGLRKQLSEATGSRSTGSGHRAGSRVA